MRPLILKTIFALALLFVITFALNQAQAQPPGGGGPPGLEGIAGEDGLNCWDLDGDGEMDGAEDINGDGVHDALDCQGPAGPPGADGADGEGLPTGGADGNILIWDASEAEWGQVSGDTRQPWLGIHHVIALVGIFPSRNSDPFIGEIRMVGFNFAPRGWAFCDGQLLSIAQNTALFSLLGTSFGGDGRTTFALPDLRGRVAIHPGTGPGLSPYQLGQKGGSEKH